MTNKTKKHWTPQRIVLIILGLALIGYKLITEDDIPTELAIGAVVVGGLGTLMFFVLGKKGIFKK